MIGEWLYDSRSHTVASNVSAMLAAAVAAALFTIATLQDTAMDDYTLPLPLDIAIGLVACLLLLLRRRYPMALALVLIVLGLLAVTAFAIAFAGVFNVALRRSWRMLLLITTLHIGPVALFSVAEGFDSRLFLEAFVFVCLIDLVLIFSALLLRSVRERGRQAAETSRLRVLEARRQERARIAREMHDVLAHRISLVAMLSGAMEFRPDASREQLLESASVIRVSAYEALEELREVIGVLRDDSELDADPESALPQPVLADLPDLVRDNRSAGMPVDIDVRVPDTLAVPTRIGRHAYRIAQEGLTNARKHAPGQRVRVTLAGDQGGELTVEIRNELPEVAGSAQVPGAGAGLVGLRERAELVGGRLEHGRTAGGEFRLKAWLPWPDPVPPESITQDVSGTKAG